MTDENSIDHFVDYLNEAAEFLDKATPIENALPFDKGKKISDDIRKEYFTANKFPYEERLTLKDFHRQNYPLQVELVKLQNWIKQTHSKLIIIFEGRDTAGKGTTIKRFTEHLNPRGARVVALDKPSDRERDQWYFQRYVDYLPTGGEIVFFDRSWYNRAGVERVMGFCTEEEYWEFTRQAPDFERMLARSGIIIIKFYLSVSRSEQARRLKEREQNPLKQWKLSPMDKEAQAKWDAYTEAKEATFKLTDSAEAPWIIVKAEDKLRTKLNTIRHVLCSINYEGKDMSAIEEPDPLIVAPASVVFA